MKFSLWEFDDIVVAAKNSEATKVIKNIKEHAFSLHTEEELRLFIQNHQSALIEYKQNQTLSKGCDEVLFFMESQFANFINKNLPASDLLVDSIFKKHSSVIKSAKTIFSAVCGAKMKQICKPLLFPSNKQVYIISHVHYFNFFWEKWSITKHSATEQAIVNVLLSCNFNTPDFFNYLVNAVVEQVNNEDNPQLHEDILLHFQKNLIRVPSIGVLSYSHEYPLVKGLYASWLKQEIKYCRRKHKNFNAKQTTLVAKVESKIETSLSVAQTAYFLKVLYQAGVFTNASQTEILQVASKFFKSKKSNDISFGSIHNKYYEIEDKTKDSVHQLLADISRNNRAKG